MTRKRKVPNHGKSVERLQILLKEYGSEAVQQAKKSILDELFNDEVVSNALRYFMCDYWKDYTTPTLLSLSHGAVRGDSKSLANVASALILINGAIDIHDDIIDCSKQKDSRPTVFGKFGKEIALLVGDALFVKGLLTLTEVCRTLDAEKCGKIMSLLKQGLFELGEGEAMELKCRGTADVKPRDYLMVMKKKAADVEALMRLGAVLGNARKSEIEALGKYGRILGLISILRDDIIDMTLQEELRHRLKHECLPLPLLYAMQDSSARFELLKLIKNGMKTDVDYVRICSLAKHGCGFEKARNYIDELVGKGKALTSNIDKKQELQLILTSLADT
jgi:heptaprenyl diphosphate synthase